jgi:hypothetical protein
VNTTVHVTASQPWRVKGKLARGGSGYTFVMNARYRLFVLLAVLVSWWILLFLLGTLLAAVLAMDWPAGGFGVRSFPSLMEHWVREPEFWLSMAILVTVLVGSQVVFLLPVMPLRVRAGRPRSLRYSIILASLCAAMLTVGLAMGLASLVQLIGGWLDAAPVSLYIGAYAIAVEGFTDESLKEPGFIIAVACFVVSWILWSILIVKFMRRGQPLDRMTRLTGLLFAGTLIELVLILPLEAMVRRRADCVCQTGSFQSLLGGFVAALWLLGPVAFLIVFRRRSSWWARHCQRCGYGKDQIAGDRCPECGWLWNSAKPNG